MHICCGIRIDRVRLCIFPRKIHIAFEKALVGSRGLVEPPKTKNIHKSTFDECNLQIEFLNIFSTVVC